MAQISNADNELREEEFLCLESLLSPEEFQKIDARNGVIEVYTFFENGVEVILIESLEKLENLKTWVDTSGEPDQVLGEPDQVLQDRAKLLDEKFQSDHKRVSHLPPIRVKFFLPDGYPSQEPPHVSLSTCWIPRRVLQQLETFVKELWMQNGQQAVLYELFQFLTDRATAGSFFPFPVHCLPIFCQEKISTTATFSLLESSSFLVVPQAVKLFRSCFQFNENRIVVDFQQKNHLCQVCLESFPGTNFIRLTNCGDFVCKNCMTGFCVSLIKDGSVSRLECLKCQKELNPFDVEISVDSENWQKYQKFQIDSALSSMKDVVFCPRIFCNQPVLKETDSDAGRCPGCAYVFCIHCRKGFHGIEPCLFDGDKKILAQEYEFADQKTKTDMEKRYGGRIRLQNLCDEIKAEDWVSKNAKQCPKCSFPVEKMGGCNKMVCTKCSSAFCWLCLAKLGPPNPYAHFQDPLNKNCYNNLMQGIEDSDDDDDDNDNNGHGNDEDSDDDEFNDAGGWVDLGADRGALFLLEELRQVLGAAAALFDRL